MPSWDPSPTGGVASFTLYKQGEWTGTNVTAYWRLLEGNGPFADCSGFGCVPVITADKR